jgi:protein-S-isoprenylcysteine O-methyltransferase Ste14
MDRAHALIGSAVFLFLAPGTVAGLVPWLITRWRLPAAGVPPLAAVVGTLFILAGAAVLLESFLRFAREGQGTPAPLAPTRKLVVTGAYRFVRNPMYVAVLALILGQVLVFQDPILLVYGAAVAFGFHLFVTAFEEPRLRREFPAEYEAYSRHVRRWIPRLRPWSPTGAG